MNDKAVALTVVGMNHQSAPLEARERLNLPLEQIDRALQRIRGRQMVDGVMLLSTCNRVEYYFVGAEEQQALVSLEQHLAEDRGLRWQDFKDQMYIHCGVPAVRHLFRVASSIDSMVVGEPQILGQVKEAYFHTVRAGTSDRLLDRILHRAFTVAKRVRSETGIARNAISVSHIAVDLARKVFGGFIEQRCLVLGSGEMAELTVRYLMEAGLKDLLVANRTFERAFKLAKQYGGTAVPWEKVGDYLERVDIVIASTTAEKYVLTQTQVEEAIRRRRQKPLFMIDISVPRNLDPGIDKIGNCFVYDIDGLQEIVEEHRREREGEINDAEQIIDSEIEVFLRSLSRKQASPMIRLLSEKAETIRARELERSLAALKTLDPDGKKVIDQMSRSIVKRLIHDPIEFIKAECLREEEERNREFVERVFKLENLWKNGEKSEDDPDRNQG